MQRIIIRFSLIILLAISACRSESMREPTFVEKPILSALKTNLEPSAFWTEISFLAPSSEDILVIDLRLASAFGSSNYTEVCTSAAKIVSGSLPSNIQRKIRLVREWRVIHNC